MASQIWESGQTSKSQVTSVSYTYKNSDFATQLAAIPAYATISSVRITAKIQTNLYTNYGQLTVGSKTWKTEDKNTRDWVTIVENLDITSYLTGESGTENAGELPDITIYASKAGSIGIIRTFKTEVTIVWTYTPASYKISTAVSPTGGGTVTGGGTYEHGATATLKATPATGYKFVKWNDGNTSATRTVTVTGAATYTATFEKLKYTATFKNGDGTTLETVTVEHGSTPTCSKTPTKASTAEYTYTFSGWTPALGALTANQTYTPNFTETKRSYNVTFKDENGSTLKTESVQYGAKPTPPTAPTKADTAQWKYTFDGWYDANGNKLTSSTTVTGAVTYTARYSATVKFYSIKVILFDSEETYVREYNTQLTIEAPTVKGYRFVKWSDGDTNASRTITVTGEATYTAIYEKLSIPIYVNDIRAKAVYVDINNQIAFIVIDGAVPETTPDNYTVDGWSFKVVSAIPTGDGVKAVTQIYKDTMKIYQA